MKDDLKEIYIIGAGGFGRDVLDTIYEINKIRRTFLISGVIDEDGAKKGESLYGTSVLGNLSVFQTEKFRKSMVRAIVAIADPRVKERIVNSLKGKVEWETIVHPKAFISSTAKVGEGSIIQCFSAINANVVLGKHCIINSNCVIGHDTVIENYSSFMHMCGIMGNCKISERTYVGAGAVSLQGITIGSDAVIGAGSVVINDVEASATVVGNPARRIK